MLTIKEAFALRAEIRSHSSIDKPLSNVITEILFGAYDKHTSESEEIALEDYDFLTSEDKEWEIFLKQIKNNLK